MTLALALLGYLSICMALVVAWTESVHWVAAYLTYLALGAGFLTLAIVRLA